MEGTFFWVTAVIAAMMVGLGKGGLPVITSLAVPILSFSVSPVAAAGLLLPVYVASDMFGLYAYRRDFSWPVLRIMLIAMPIGVMFGWATAHIVTDSMVKVLVGSIGTIFALGLILRRPVAGPGQPVRWGKGLFWGAVAGFTSFVSHSGGPPYQLFVLPLRLSKTAFAGTATISFAYTNGFKLIPYWALGQINPVSLHIALILALPAILAVFIGAKLVRIMPEKLFFRIVVWALFGVSLRLLWIGGAGLLA